MAKTAFVYRYTDIDDGIIKYVGIVYRSDLSKRLYVHRRQDKWRKWHRWKVEYFECKNRSEAEAFESHLIAKYETHRYFNKAKKGWGENSFLPDVEDWWMVAEENPINDYGTFIITEVIRDMIQNKYYREALTLLGCLEVTYD